MKNKLKTKLNLTINFFLKNPKYIIYPALYLFCFFILYITIWGTPKTYGSFDFFRNFVIFFATIVLFKNFLYLAVSPFYTVIKLNKRNKKYNPKVSVIVPAWNEEVGISTTIESLLESSYKNLEIIIINDGSVDGSDEIIKNIKIKYENMHLNDKKFIKPQLLYHYKQNGGKGHALNTGIEISTGEIIISIDADCFVEKDTVKNFASVFSDKKVMAAVGKVYIGNTQTIIGVIQYLEFLFSFYSKKADSIMNSIYIIGGAAGAFRKKIFTDLGPYNTKNITEDIELSMRIQDAGYKIVYVDDAVVYTEGAVTIKSLIKQRLRWKRGRFETFFQFKHLFFSEKRKHKKILSWLILPLSFFAEIQMFMEPFFLLTLYTYSILTNDYASFVSGIIVATLMFLIIYTFDNFNKRNISRIEFLFLAPISWLLFYIASLVEFIALIQSVSSILKKQDLKWQRWDRVGISKD